MVQAQVRNEPGAVAKVRGGRLLPAPLLVFGLVLVSSSLQAAIAPLLPGYAREFGLSGFQTGAVVGVAGVGIFAVALPAGALADRLGARRLTLVAGWLLALGAFLQAEPRSFSLLLTARLVFGLGYGAVWTAGVAWLAGMATDGRGAGVAVTLSGVGGVVGPAVAGLLAATVGAEVLFLASGMLLAALTLGLTVASAPTRAVQAVGGRSGVGAQLRTALRADATVAAVAAVVAAVIAATLATVLAPLELQSAGESPGEIGLAFALAGALFILVSVGATVLRPGAARLPAVVASTVVLIAALTPAALSTTVAALVIMLCMSTAARAALWTSAYPLGAAGADKTGAGVGVVTGMLNVVWALTTCFASLLAGVLESHVGARATFALAQLLALAVLGATVLRTGLRRPTSPGGGALVPQSAPADASA